MHPTKRTLRAFLPALALIASAGALLLAGTPAVAQAAGQSDLKPTTSDAVQQPAAKKPAAKTANKTAAQSEGAKAKTAPAAPERTAARTGSKTEQSIVALVNDEPITGYEVRQRSEMLSGGAVAEYVKGNVESRWKSIITGKNIQQEFQEYAKKRQPKSKEQLAAVQKDFVVAKRNAMMAQLQAEARSRTGGKASKDALEELIDEKLKMQEAKRVGASPPDDEIDNVIKSIAERNKMTLEQLAQNLGGSLDPMKNRVRSTLAWNDVIRRKFGQQIAVASKDVDKYVASAAAAGAQDDVELNVQRIRLNMPAKLDQAGVAQRVSQAETLRAKFTDCKGTQALVAGAAGVRFEDMGKRRAAQFPEPTRSLILNAKDNEMLPPAVSEDGIDLFAVCSRSVVKAEDQKRTQAEGELKQKEFELLSKRHLKDLRQDAAIEYR